MDSQLNRSTSASGDESPGESLSTAHQVAEPLLAIEWKAFDYAYNGDFQVAGIPVLLSARVPSRPLNEQQNGDTGRCVWDAAVVLLRFLDENLESLLESQQQAFLKPPPIVVELGAGRGLVGLGTAAILTALASKRAQIQQAEGETHSHSCRVLLTDLDYCLESLHETVAFNRHFAMAPSSVGFPALADNKVPMGAAHDVSEKPRAEVAVEPLDWFCPEKCYGWGMDKAAFLSPSLIVAADILWLRELVQPFVHTLAFFLGRGTGNSRKLLNTATHQAPLIIVAHQSRCSSVDSLFFATLKACGLRAEPLAYESPSHKVTLFAICCQAM